MVEPGLTMTKIIAINPTGLMSGAETVLARMLTAAKDDGMAVACACPDGPLAAHLKELDLEWLPLPDLKLPSGNRLRAIAVLLARTLRAAAQLRSAGRHADVILVNGFFALPAVWIGRVGAPTIWLVHDVVHRRSWLTILRVTKSGVQLAVAVSDAVAEPLRTLGIPVRVERNGTAWPVIPTTWRPGDTPVIGCVAALTSWKGQHVLLEAAAALGDLDIVVELVGGQFPKDGPYVDQLRVRAALEDLRNTVKFVGPVSDPLSYLRRWAVLVSSSVEPEAAPLNLLEAMSTGVPVVATNHGGSPEVLGAAGILVPPGDPGALETALRTLLTDPERWVTCHAAGPRQIASGLTLREQQVRFVTLLREWAKSGAVNS
jgi:glycosyltransferase involved in cell wall biosynthesis